MSRDVTLVDSTGEPDERDVRHVRAYRSDGAIVIAGEDLGPTSSSFFGSSSYEFWWTIPKAKITTFMKRIGGDHNDPLGTLEQHWSGNERFRQLEDHLQGAKLAGEVRFESWYSPD